jgi:lipoyl(octanoyl) transferase
MAIELLKTRWLGRIQYAEGIRLQEDILAAKVGKLGGVDELLLLEHEPVYTIGRGSDRASLGERQEALPYPVVETNRGGKATYHGPGQLVGYALLDLRVRGQDLHRHLRSLEEGLVECCQILGVKAGRREGLTGVWVGRRKLASIGVGVRRWITMHGFGLNVCGPLGGFEHITPCGLEGVEMTSLEAEGVKGVTVESVSALASEVFRRILGKGE